jgi:phosphoribosylamine--glycine ligase
MKRYVCKPIDGSVEDKSLSYCSKSPQDMVYMLERWKKLNQGALKGGLLLQEFIAGVEFAVGGWFGPHGFNRGLCENFEFKKLFPGDLGVATGEMGTVLAYTRKSKLAEKVLIPVESLLARLGHVGYVDVNCIIDDHGAPWPLEFTMRPGWPTFNIQQVLHKGDPVVWMAELCDGYDSRNTIDNEVALGTCVAIPDFPYSNLTKKEVCGIPVYGITPGMWEYFHPCEMQMCTVPKQVGEQIVNCPTPATAGDYVCVMTATAPTIAKARERVYRRLKRLEIPNSPMYRIDLGLRLKSQLPELQRHGYATAFQYS